MLNLFGTIEKRSVMGHNVTLFPYLKLPNAKEGNRTPNDRCYNSLCAEDCKKQQRKGENRLGILIDSIIKGGVWNLNPMASSHSHVQRGQKFTQT